jgi:hypothetical protein
VYTDAKRAGALWLFRELPAMFPICFKGTNPFGWCVTRDELRCVCTRPEVAVAICRNPDDGVRCIPEGDACRNRPDNCCSGLACAMNDRGTISTCLAPCTSDGNCTGSQTCRSVPDVSGSFCWPPNRG